MIEVIAEIKNLCEDVAVKAIKLSAIETIKDIKHIIDSFLTNEKIEYVLFHLSTEVSKCILEIIDGKCSLITIPIITDSDNKTCLDVDNKIRKEISFSAALTLISNEFELITISGKDPRFDDEKIRNIIKKENLIR